MARPQGLSDARSIRGIVFDLDGTLIDSYEAIGDSLNHALAGLGRGPRDMFWVREMVGRGLEVLIEEALGTADGAGEAPAPAAIAQGVRLFRARYDEICVGRTRLMPDVAETLAALRARGYRMAVATNKPSYFASRLLAALDVGEHLDAVLGPDLVAHPKPHPEMLLAALTHLRVRCAEAVYVGDMEIDVQTARAAGVQVIVLPTGSRDLRRLGDAGADLVLPSFAALLDTLPGPLLESGTL